MKKLFLVGLIALTASCQSVDSTPTHESTPTIAINTPTLVAATVTPTLTPIPTLSPTPIPFYFTDEFDSDLSAWTSFQTSGEAPPYVAVENGSLNINFSWSNSWVYAIHNAHEYSSVHVDAKFYSTDSETASLGLICMYDESHGWIEYNLSSDGTYNVLVGQWLASGIAQYTPVVHDSSEYLTRGKSDYEIGLTCKEDLIWLYINGKLFRNLNVARYGLKEGRVGIAAAVFDKIPVVAYFEWFKTSEPTE